MTAAPLVELTLETDAFARDWSHCDQIANYLGQLVAHDRPDSFLYANLLSTVLNELFEAVFARHHAHGAVRCTLARNGRHDRVELLIPADAAVRAFYKESVAAAQAGDVAEAYTRALLGKESPAGLLGMLELAADYGAQLSVEESASGEEIHFILQVTLEDGGLPANQDNGL